ncbi:MAG: hypothetical protein LBC79_09260, partial [Deltaproteobacteria bacterium]|nr:hypothetical protein [Deltaproteobacteria bacterium]
MPRRPATPGAARRYASAIMDTQKISPFHGYIRPLAWVSGLAACCLLLTGFVLPHVLRPVLEKRMSLALNSPSRVESLSFNPFTLTLTALNIAVPYPG